MKLKTGMLLPVVFGLALAGCGDDTPTPPGLGGGGCGLLGTSNVSVTGAVTASLNACAFYAIAPASGSNPAIFALTLTAGSASAPTHTLGLGREGTRPSNGTYNVGGSGSTDWNGTFVYDAATDRNFVVTGGTVTVTTSNAGNLAGTVNLTATEANAGAATITLTGSFAAKCIDTAQSDC